MHSCQLVSQILEMNFQLFETNIHLSVEMNMHLLETNIHMLETNNYFITFC